MEFAFRINNVDELEKYQRFFFKQGFTWSDGTTDILYSKSNGGEIKVMYIDPIHETIQYSGNDKLDKGSIECKMLHPKQKEFLNRYSKTCDIIQRASRRGFYELNDATFLNNLLLSDKLSAKL